MLTSVPEGQPFEVDTRLLYSPESSSGGETSAGHDSPADSRASTCDGSRGAGRVQFSLPAYRQSTNGSQPLFSDIGQAASVLSPLQQHMGPSHDGSSVSGLLSPQDVGASSWRSQQHAAGPQSSSQDYQQQQRQMRPSSAPLRGGGGGASGSRPARQLLLDDAAQFGVQGRTAGARTGVCGRSQVHSSIWVHQCNSRNHGALVWTLPGAWRRCSCPGYACHATTAAFLWLTAPCRHPQNKNKICVCSCPPARLPPRSADLLQHGRERRLEQLAQPRTELWQRCAHIKMQEEQEQLMVGYGWHCKLCF